MIDRPVQLISKQPGCAKQTGVKNARLEFSADAGFQTFAQKWLLANIKYSYAHKKVDTSGASGVPCLIFRNYY